MLDVVVHAGMQRKLAQDLLASSDGLDEIEAARQLAQQVSVDGVPFFIINRKIALAGAQPAESFLEAFRQMGQA